MNSKSKSHYRTFYLILSDLNTISRPFARFTSLELEEAAKAKTKHNGAHVISASEYRQLTGRTAASDYRREMEME